MIYGYARAKPDIAVNEITDRLGVSPVTLYRYIPATAKTADGGEHG